MTAPEKTYTPSPEVQRWCDEVLDIAIRLDPGLLLQNQIQQRRIREMNAWHLAIHLPKPATPEDRERRWSTIDNLLHQED